MIPFPDSRLRALKIVLALSLGYEFICYLIWLAQPSTSPFGDFFGLWSAGRFVATAAGAVYDPVLLQEFQRLSETSFPQELYYPYPYPPTILLVLAPLGLLPLGPAYALWMGTTFTAYLWATLGRRCWSWSGVALLAAPTTFLTMIAGQNGFLTAALLVGGLRSLGRAPIVGGVLLGLLSYKPQFGLLVPVALLAARQGRAISAAGLTVLACIAVSSALFGWSIWRDWFDSLPLYQALLKDNRPTFLHLMPTLAASIEETTGSVLLANSVQAAATLAVAILVWRCFASSIERGIVPLLVGTVLATPYGFIYDVPMIAAATVLEWQWRRTNGLSIATWEAALVVAFFECATVMSAHSLPFAAAATLIAILARLIWVRTRA
jgi:Glycosyltransferase family 87